ncbi:MAG TPA: hypothetical protein ENK35_12330 [Candidatus Tenderia sp.]|nr:hypothetical protein [Candidatus Tenderia sp.]
MRVVRVPRLGLILVALLVLSACSVVDEKRQAYRHAKALPPLQIPAGLDRPDETHALMLPEVRPDYQAPNTEPPPLAAE